MTVNDHQLIFDEYAYINPWCSGDLVFKQTSIYSRVNEGQATTLDGQLVDRIKTQAVEGIYQMFDPFFLALLVDDYVDSCGFAPKLAEKIYFSKCKYNSIGKLEYRIYRVDGDTLYIVTDSAVYPEYLPVDAIFFFDKYSRAE